ncbi:11795_t:CDS:1, partial [Gigaspora margarita]
DTIKGVAKILIKKLIYPKEDQIKSEVENYIQANYIDNFQKFMKFILYKELSQT